MSVSIQTVKLTKFYGKEKVAALSDLDLSINSGEIYGYLGANGAGKSTTIRLLLNFLQPSSGSAKILNHDSVKDSTQLKKHVGYLAGDVALYQKTTGEHFLDYMSSLQPTTKYRGVLEKRFEADLKKPISALSKGNRQKLGVIQAFMHEPDVLILDEPSSGLDPLMQEALYKTLREAKDRGAAILMSSHNLDEAQRVCDRIGIIKRGKLVREQKISSDQQVGAPYFIVTFDKIEDLKKCKKSTMLKVVSGSDNNELTAIFQAKNSISEALAEFSHYKLKNFATKTADLEDEFLSTYGGSK